MDKLRENKPQKQIKTTTTPLKNKKTPHNNRTTTTVNSSLKGVRSITESVQVRRTASIQRIPNVNADITIYANGSAPGGTKIGGAGMVVVIGDAESHNL